jgi:hypothetical protein
MFPLHTRGEREYFTAFSGDAIIRSVEVHHRVRTAPEDHTASCSSKARCLGSDLRAWRVSWVAGLRRWQGHDQRTLLLEKGENVAMHVGIVLAHNHMSVALFPEQLLVR